MAHKPSFSFLVSLLVLGGAVAVHAGMPEKVVYQGRLSRSGAAVAQDQQIKVTLIDPNGVESPQIVFSSLVSLAATGEFSVLLNMPPNYDWERAAPELEIEVGGEVLTPREKINVSPYAFLAKKVAAGGVSAAAIGAGQVLDVHVSTIAASKVVLPNSGGKDLTNWQFPGTEWINGAKVTGTVNSIPTAHAGRHVLPGGVDPLVNLTPAQVADTAVVARSTFTQIIQPRANVLPLAVKPNPGVNALDPVFEVYDTSLSTAMAVRGDGQAYFKGNVGVGTPTPSERLEVVGGNLKVSGGMVASTLTLTGNASAVNLNAMGNLGVVGTATAGSLNVSGAASVGSLTTSGNIGIGTNSPSAKLDVRGGINFTSQKLCRVIVPNMFTFSTLVPSGWTSATCANFMANSGGLQFQLGCIFENGFSLGGINGGIPSPNCSW
jgi:hypothetical protein